MKVRGLPWNKVWPKDFRSRWFKLFEKWHLPSHTLLASYSTTCSSFGVFAGENQRPAVLFFHFCIKIAIFHSFPAFTRSEPRGPVCVPACVRVLVLSQLIAHATGAISLVSNLYFFSSCLWWLTPHLLNHTDWPEGNEGPTIALDFRTLPSHQATQNEHKLDPVAHF